MKRVATIFFSFMIIMGLLGSASAQVSSHKANSGSTAISGNTVTTVNSTSTTVRSSSSKGSSALNALNQTDAVSYFQDTTSINWWLYAPIMTAPVDSLNYFRMYGFNPDFYAANADSIGPVEINHGTPQDTTFMDTMYDRVMGLRVSVPTDIKNSIYLDSASITVYPISFNATDSLKFWVVPIEDVAFSRNNVPIGNYPIPNLFGTAIARAAISSSMFTMGQLNTVTVSFKHKLLVYPNRTQFAICVFVDGPNFPTDTVAFQLDANLQPVVSSLAIDTDGQLNSLGGIPMRTYKLSLDAGHEVLYHQATTSYVGGGGGFWANVAQVDQTGAQTGNAYDGNLVLVTYLDGTAAGVGDNPASVNSLDGNYPNPVGTSTAINYTLAQSGPVSLTVYNTLGQQVRTVVNSMQGAGEHTANFTAGTLPNGMYYYKLQSGDFTATRTMVIDR